MTNIPILSLLIFFPFIGALVILLINKNDQSYEKKVKEIGLWVSIINFLLSLILLYSFDKTESQFQFIENFKLINDLGIYYYLGIDGISLSFILLTTLLIPICIITSWNKISKNVSYFIALFLIIECFLIGVFSSLDLFIFYIFFEGSLIPLFLIIGIWGGSNRVYASYKFFLFTIFGSLLMLLGIITLYFYSGTSQLTLLINTNIPFILQIWLFLSFFASFAIKIPMWPFHTWLPDAHVEAPAPISVLLAGLLLKMGGYGFLRFNIGLLPEASAQYAWIFILIGVITMFYGAFVALVQTDIKKMIALTSINHMGFVILGAFTGTVFGISGAIFQMFTHAAAIGLMFMLSGYLHKVSGTRDITVIKGLKFTSPRLASLLVLGSMAAMALPIFSSFLSEYMVIVGAINVNPIYAVTVAIPVITVAYFLWMLQRVVMSNPTTVRVRHHDLGTFSTLTLVLYLIPLVLTLVVPWLILGVSNPISEVYTNLISSGAA